jgi:hypothetical protein
MKPDTALLKLLFGGEFFRERDELKRALLVDALCLLLVLLGLAVAARGQSQEQNPNQNQQANSQSQSQAPSKTSNPAQGTAPGEAQKNAPAKKKRVYTEEDLAGIKGGVSVVGDPNPVPNQAKAAQASEEATTGADSSKKDEKYWRDRAGQIHAEMDSLDQQMKDLQADIQKNGAAGFDAQKGLKDNVIYVDDKNARLQRMQKKRADLDQKLDELQEQGRKAGIPPSWVR